MKGLKAILYYFLVDLFTLLCWAQSKGGQHFGSTVVVSDVNLSNHGDLGSSEPPQTAEGCRGYFDVMGQWDPPFNCSSGEFLYCCGTCGFRYCCKFKQAKLDQSICTNYDRPNWLAPGKTPPKIDDPLLDPNRDKANLIVYIICGVVAVMVLVGIFTKLGLEKAHRPQRENMSRALADVMRQQGHCTADHMERDANLVVHVQHYETMPRSSANNLPKRHINDTPTHLCRITPDLVIGRAPTDTSKINNVVPTSPHLPQMAHPHSYPTMGQISNPYEQQPPGKELNKYASLKAVAEKGNDDFYSKRRHLAELAAKGSLPLHPVRMEQDSPVGGTLKLNGQKSKVNKIHTHPLSSTYNPDYKTWDHTEHSLRRQAYATKKHCPVESVNEQIPSQNQHYIPPQPYFVTNSKTEVTV
ncbi:protein shisa-9 isoform X1 [Spea bombifrons]|uniref:protein shisa-9 isoform X1 n=1 Tax=Spea bombifrons TaxID=233779 RepID=UPI00234A05B4|nr:protein shisa-9 isoform X1 [Spea bombifrons]